MTRPIDFLNEGWLARIIGRVVRKQCPSLVQEDVPRGTVLYDQFSVLGWFLGWSGEMSTLGDLVFRVEHLGRFFKFQVSMTQV
jgi:hypothetical protein